MIVPGYTHPAGAGRPFGPRPYEVCWDAPHYVYSLTGPSGIYIGCSTDPERRFRGHRVAANSKPSGREQMITLALRHDGADSYTLAILACAIGYMAGGEIEFQTIRSLRKQGERVLNVVPRTPLHTPPRHGRFVGVVVNGRVEPLFPTAEQQGA